MASYNSTHVGIEAGNRFTAFRADLRQRFEAWKTYRNTVNELNALTNRELADLGLHRSGIRGIAMETAYGT